MLTHKIAVVTGGSRGLGRATVERFAQEGAIVLTGSTREPDTPLPAGVHWQHLDVQDSASIDALINKAHKDHGRVDILVNNAGIEIEETVETSTDDDWRRMADINMKAVFLATRTVVPLMRENGGGVIVNVGSISGFVSDPNLALYNASKAWVISLTRSTAVDHGLDGIRCNAVCPGWIMTDMLMQTLGQGGDTDAAIADAVAKHPIGRIGDPIDIANAVLWLASDQSSFVSGTTLTVDGGLTAGIGIDPKNVT
ncbi:MAG: SDR family oxidoreductase [Rhodospirillales bacterium]|jgi:NAD(P)-dependent dehydrogenase (short-subunit alcohol dehydrogenase family)|nr:SDR family oxidoreductase [Rhodospirillales bacterium]MBT4628025.1 SDR family oxidoreductase [Rhodospirillales bacterium]MBT5520885.1 SDR family oxidoreductase [Rhodospirillales bacterium]MBT6111893.1 SDR family oxidoreductase [Rhodospirillales bacterium]MBT7147788.1 SDR family oxidoreductase [Rhodospirillales bacterium]